MHNYFDGFAEDRLDTLEGGIDFTPSSPRDIVQPSRDVYDDEDSGITYGSWPEQIDEDIY